MHLNREPPLQGGQINYLFFVLKGGTGYAFPRMLGISVTSEKKSTERAIRAPGTAKPV